MNFAVWPPISPHELQDKPQTKYIKKKTLSFKIFKGERLKTVTVAKSFNFSKLAEVSLREFQTIETCTLPVNLQTNISILTSKIFLNSPTCDLNTQ